MRILITGHCGLVGSSLTQMLRISGADVTGIDLRGKGASCGNILDVRGVQAAIANCQGVVHLAGVSRVIDGERDPDLCTRTNVTATSGLIDAAKEAGVRWLLYASSREVYGEAEILPVRETAILNPMNHYGRTKAAAERLVCGAADRHFATGVVRLSNVYGSVVDHIDRVVPAFITGALLGRPLEVQGADNTFDFTHVTDVARGLVSCIKILSNASESLAPVHLVSGVPTTLSGLAEMAIDLAFSESKVVVTSPRSYDVSKFYGDGTRALELLGWKVTVPLVDGLRNLLDEFKGEYYRLVK